MADNIRLEVVTPEKEVVNDMAQIVMAPGSLGEFGVLSGHTRQVPSITGMKTARTNTFSSAAGLLKRFRIR
jgi:F-type H+-transporting ATPase subunit epsilon